MKERIVKNLFKNIQNIPNFQNLIEVPRRLMMKEYLIYIYTSITRIRVCYIYTSITCILIYYIYKSITYIRVYYIYTSITHIRVYYIYTHFQKPV